MKQFVIDANKCVLNRPSPEAKVEDGEFEENEVYAIDIVVSTGDGKTRVRLRSLEIVCIGTPPHPPPFCVSAAGGTSHSHCVCVD